MFFDFIVSRQGEFAALLTAFLWAVTALAFESAGKRVGSLTVNLIRLVFALAFLSVFTWISRGKPLPIDASTHQWVWLSLSGLVGFVMGDLLLFKAYIVIGARISMLIMSLAPLVAAMVGWVWLGEVLTPKQIVAMVVTFAGISVVVLHREREALAPISGGWKSIKLSYPVGGLLLAFGGAVGQGAGLVISKYGMVGYDVFAAVQIRIIAGIVGFAALFFILNRWKHAFKALTDRKAIKWIAVGSFFGPFLGVSFSLWAIQFTTTGVASAIMSIVPVLIIPLSIFLLKERVSPKEFIGATVAIGGVFLFFL